MVQVAICWRSTHHCAIHQFDWESIRGTESLGAAGNQIEYSPYGLTYDAENRPRMSRDNKMSFVRNKRWAWRIVLTFFSLLCLRLDYEFLRFMGSPEFVPVEGVSSDPGTVAFRLVTPNYDLGDLILLSLFVMLQLFLLWKTYLAWRH